MVDSVRPTKKQRELLNFIDGFIKGNGYGPSYREIMRALDYKSVSTVAIHVDGLIARGYLRKRDKSARSLEVVPLPGAIHKESAGAPEVSHEDWLASQIDDKLQAADDETKAVLVKARELLLPSDK